MEQGWDGAKVQKTDQGRQEGGSLANLLQQGLRTGLHVRHQDLNDIADDGGIVAGEGVRRVVSFRVAGGMWGRGRGGWMVRCSEDDIGVQKGQEMMKVGGRGHEGVAEGHGSVGEYIGDEVGIAVGFTDIGDD